ncbi:MAG: hypothetical protein K6A80_07675 [Saccharofermentans sp.]|nr:hypothetical protein [Saccharofermentans sp.]
MSFDRIVGQQSLKKRMGKEIMARRGSTYIVSGASGCGKTLIAGELAAGFLCKDPSENGACGKCDCCRYLENETNPDLLRVGLGKNETIIPVDRIREKVVADYDMTPSVSPVRVNIIDGDHLGIESQNALLKSIEEPPADVIFIFEVTNTETLLPTILSRAVEYKVASYSSDEVKEIVKATCENVPEDELGLLADFADGIPGRAIRIATDESFINLKDDIVDMMLGMPGRSITDAIRNADEIFGEYKDRYLEPVTLMLWIIGDLMRLESDIDCESIRFTKDRIRLEKFIVSHKNIGIKEFGRVIEAINGFIADRKVNINYEGSVTAMTLRIYKEFNK